MCKQILSHLNYETYWFYFLCFSVKSFWLKVNNDTNWSNTMTIEKLGLLYSVLYIAYWRYELVWVDTFLIIACNWVVCLLEFITRTSPIKLSFYYRALYLIEMRQKLKREVEKDQTHPLLNSPIYTNIDYVRKEKSI